MSKFVGSARGQRGGDGGEHQAASPGRGAGFEGAGAFSTVVTSLKYVSKLGRVLLLRHREKIE